MDALTIEFLAIIVAKDLSILTEERKVEQWSAQ